MDFATTRRIIGMRLIAITAKFRAAVMGDARDAVTFAGAATNDAVGVASVMAICDVPSGVARYARRVAVIRLAAAVCSFYAISLVVVVINASVVLAIAIVIEIIAVAVIVVVIAVTVIVIDTIVFTADVVIVTAIKNVVIVGGIGVANAMIIIPCIAVGSPCSLFGVFFAPKRWRYER